MFGKSNLRKEVERLGTELRYHSAYIDGVISTSERVSRRVSDLEEKQRQVTEVLALADITEEAIEKNMLKKLGEGWRISSSYLSILHNMPGIKYTLYKPDGLSFSHGKNKIDVLRDALKKKEEAKCFCAQPAKKSKKGGK